MTITIAAWMLVPLVVTICFLAIYFFNQTPNAKDNSNLLRGCLFLWFAAMLIISFTRILS